MQPTSPYGLDIDDEGLVSFARALASTPSVSGTEGPLVEATAEQMRRLGFEVEVDEVGNCVATMGAGDGPRLLVDGHIDSIPLHSQDRWTVGPFSGEIIDGRLYGLGICDQKASIAAAAYGVAAAYRAYGDRLGGTVAVVASVNEEDIEGAALASVVQRFRPGYAITSEPSDTRLCLGQRGRAKVEATVVGRACHAGHASRGINAMEALAAMVVEVRDMSHPVHDRLGRRDITCIDAVSAPYPSVSTVPGSATARFDARFVPGETPESLLADLRRAAERAWAGWTELPSLELALVMAEFTTWKGAAFRMPEFEAAWWTEEASPLAGAAARALAGVGLDPSPTHYSFCTNGSYLAGEAEIPTIGFGVGEEHMAHQANEHVTLESLRKGAVGFGAIVCELLGAAAAQDDGGRAAR